MTRQKIIDLEYTLWERQKGDVTIIGTWALTNQRPILVLIPTAAKFRTYDRIRPCIVSVDDAWRWAEETGDPAWCAQVTWHFAEALGIGTSDPKALIWLTSIIREHIGDLLKIGPFPANERKVRADARITDLDTGKTHEVEVLDV